MGVSGFFLHSLMWKDHSFPVEGGEGSLLLPHARCPFPGFMCCLLPLLILQTWEGHYAQDPASCLSCLVSLAY